MNCLVPGFLAALAAVCAAQSMAGDVVLCLEAESAVRITAPMRRTDATTNDTKSPLVPGASGNAYLEIPEGSGKPPAAAGDAVLEFDVPVDGEYVLWCRVWWEDECGNSLTVRIGDGPDFAFGQGATYKTWHWVRSTPRLKHLRLKQGRLALTLKNREDGVRVDQVLLTNDPRYVPVGIEDVTVPPSS